MILTLSESHAAFKILHLTVECHIFVIHQSWGQLCGRGELLSTIYRDKDLPIFSATLEARSPSSLIPSTIGGICFVVRRQLDRF